MFRCIVTPCARMRKRGKAIAVSVCLSVIIFGHLQPHHNREGWCVRRLLKADGLISDWDCHVFANAAITCRSCNAEYGI